MLISNFLIFEVEFYSKATDNNSPVRLRRTPPLRKGDS
jgi:hypothetical protein